MFKTKQGLVGSIEYQNTVVWLLSAILAHLAALTDKLECEVEYEPEEDSAEVPG